MTSKKPIKPPSLAQGGDQLFPPVVGTGPGGDSPGRESNMVKYGSYIADLIEPREFPIFDDFWGKLNTDFQLNDSSDRISAELACVYYVRLQRAIKTGVEESVKNMDFLMRQQLKMLKVTRISREGESLNISANTTPAEWATALLETAKDEKKKPKGGKGKKTTDTSNESKK